MYQANGTKRRKVYVKGMAAVNRVLRHCPENVRFRNSERCSAVAMPVLKVLWLPKRESPRRRSYLVLNHS